MIVRLGPQVSYLTKKNTWRLAISLVVAFVLFYWLPYARQSWTEEVKLHDGRVIEVSRSSKRMRFSEPGHMGPIVGETITFEIKGEKVTWNGESKAMSFDVFDDSAYVVATQSVPEPHCEGGKTNFRYYKFDRAWQRIEPRELPDGMKIDLLFDTWRPDTKRHYTLHDKKIIDVDATHPYFVKPLKAPC